MNCQAIARILDSGKFGELSASDRRDGDAHALSCRHCAPRWLVHARLAEMVIPDMPQEFAAQCSKLVVARAGGSYLRLVPRHTLVLAGGFMMLAAAAAVVTVKYVAPVLQRAAAPAPAPAPQLERVAAAGPVAPPPARPQIIPALPPPAPHAPLSPPVKAPASSLAGVPAPQSAPSIQQVVQGESDMIKTTSIAATIAAMGAVAAAPASAQTASNGMQAGPEQIIASNDLNKDGVVTKEEATVANKTLLKMWNFYDMDGDGRVTATEVARATDAMLLATAEEKITGEKSGGPAMVKPQSAIETNDLNKDGVVTKEEAMQVGKALARLWDNYDLNKDGKVDAAEFAKAQGY